MTYMDAKVRFQISTFGENFATGNEGTSDRRGCSGFGDAREGSLYVFDIEVLLYKILIAVGQRFSFLFVETQVVLQSRLKLLQRRNTLRHLPRLRRLLRQSDWQVPLHSQSLLHPHGERVQRVEVVKFCFRRLTCVLDDNLTQAIRHSPWRLVSLRSLRGALITRFLCHKL